jgi:hypothetical protein
LEPCPRFHEGRDDICLLLSILRLRVRAARRQAIEEIVVANTVVLVYRVTRHAPEAVQVNQQHPGNLFHLKREEVGGIRNQ